MSDLPPTAPSPWLSPMGPTDQHTSAFPPPNTGVRGTLAVRSPSFGTALSLVMQTLPYVLARFAVLLGASTVTIVWLGIAFGGAGWLGAHIAGVFGFAWLVLCLGGFGFAWWGLVRYALHLISCGHVAVLTDLITLGKINNGSESMFAYGKALVIRRIGQESLLYGLNVTVRGIINSFHRTLDGIAETVGVPGLESLANLATMVMKAATTYLDKVVFSYSLSRPDLDAWTAAREGLIYYGQNAKPILKISVWVVVLDRILTAVLWIVLLAPAAILTVMLPHAMREWGGLVMLIIAALLAASIRGAFLKPIFLTMIMIRFHVAIQNQKVDPVWIYGPNGGSVSLNPTAVAVNGVVTFSNLTFTLAGQYILQINSPNITSGSPANVTINVIPAVASRLVVISQPASPVTVGSLGEYKVAVEDAYGNVITTDNSTLSVTTTDDSTLSGTLSTNAINGQADFADLTSYVAGNRYLTFTDAGLTPTDSNIVSVVAGAPVKLAFFQQPQNTAAGGSIGAVLLSVEDAYGNPVLTDHSTVTLISDDSTAISTSVSATVTDGAAVFNTLTSQLTGLHALTASDGLFAPVNSTPWMTYAGAASRLVIAAQPVTANFGQTLGAISVEVTDAYGNVVTTDHSAITLSGTDLTGTTTVNAQNGLAVFSDLTLNTDGNQVLTATNPQLPSTQSQAITINNSAVSGGYLAPITVDPSAIFPPSKTSAKWIRLELLNITTGKVVASRTNNIKAGQPVVVNNLGSNISGNYNVVAVDSLGHSATLEQISILPSAPHELWFSATPSVLDLDSIVQVSVLDKSGNLTTAADGSTITLHSWLPKGTPGAAPILTGDVTAIVVNGIATFTGLSMNQPGKAHLIARLGNLKPTVSDVFSPG